MPFAELYRRTGIQFQPFNTVYQLYADKLAGRLDQADDFLMLPEYLLWKLCGVRAREYTNATSTGLVNAGTKQYDTAILSAPGLAGSLPDAATMRRPGHHCQRPADRPAGGGG